MKLLFVAGVAVFLAYQTNAVPLADQPRSESNGGRSPNYYQRGSSQSTPGNPTDDSIAFPTTRIGEGTGVADQIAARNVDLPIPPHRAAFADVLLVVAVMLSPIAGFVVSQIVRSAILRGRFSQSMACTEPHSEGMWRNRDWYAFSLARTAKVFVSSGLITQERADAIVSAAAKPIRGKELVAIPPVKSTQPTALLLMEGSTDSIQEVEVLQPKPGQTVIS